MTITAKKQTNKRKNNTKNSEAQEGVKNAITLKGKQVTAT